MISGSSIHRSRLLGYLVAVAVAGAIALSACGGSSNASRTGAGAGTSIAAAVIAFVAPRDGADTVIGNQLGSFAATVRSRVLDDCMTSDGFEAPNFPTGGPSNDLGNPQFPNLPAIQASHDLGLFTGGGVAFFDPQSGMSAPEQRAWQARIGHCFNAMQRQTPLFGSAKFQQLSSGWFNIVNQVSTSPQIRSLSKTAAKCSAAHGEPATSVMSLFGRLQGQIGPISPTSIADSTKVQQLQAKGASVLVTCWSKVINETTAMLNDRRAVYLTQYANAVSALQSQVDTQVASVERQYGIKLSLAGS